MAGNSSRLRWSKGPMPRPKCNALHLYSMIILTYLYSDFNIFIFEISNKFVSDIAAIILVENPALYGRGCALHGLCFSISSVSFKRETAPENIYKSPSLELLLTEAETGLSRVRSIPFHGTMALVQLVRFCYRESGDGEF